MTQPDIVVENLYKSYGSTVAVDGLSFAVESGEVFGLLGPNGSGKTTTVECIEGLRQPDRGTIRVLGMLQDSSSSAIKARIGVQLQSTGLFPRLTVRETLNLYRTFFDRALPTGDLINTMELQEKADARTATLSGGQHQRLTLALALVNDPDVLFLDEPTTGMDPVARRSVWDLIGRWRAQAKTVVLTTHYMEEAAQLCDRVAVIDHGRILAMGPPDDLVRQHFTETAIEFATSRRMAADALETLTGVVRAQVLDEVTTLFSRDVPGSVAALLALAHNENVPLVKFTVRNPSLEDLFLKLTGHTIGQ